MSATSKKLFKKKAVSFSTQEVFDVGFKPDVEASFCTVSKLLFRNVINIDGSIDMEQMVNVRKRELWSYIYYLYQYNNGTLPEFVAMKNPSTGRADGMLFYQAVYGDDSNSNSNGASANSKITRKLGTDIARLVYFINKLVHTYKDDMMNPVIDYLKQLMKKEVFAKLSEIKVEMAPLPGNTSGNSIKKNVRVGFELTKP
jgi:hypothetical protein